MKSEGGLGAWILVAGKVVVAGGRMGRMNDERAIGRRGDWVTVRPGD